MKKIIPAMLAVAFTLGACNNRQQGGQEAQQADTPMQHTHGPAAAGTGEMQRIMEEMMTKMHNAAPSGNPDLDFATMMISHHEGAVAMARSELANGTDTALRSLAENIVAAQQAEIAEMKAMAAALPQGDTQQHAAAYDALMGSMSGMMKSESAPSGNADKDFVQAMIPHHEGAVAMAKVELQYGSNAKLKKMAAKMIADQEREITEMKRWLAAHP